MISALQWVKKGAALSTPERLELSDEEYERIQKEMGVQLLDAQNELEEVNRTSRGGEEEYNSETEEEMDQDVSADTLKFEEEKAPGDLSIYDLDNYDNEDENTSSPEPSGKERYTL